MSRIPHESGILGVQGWLEEDGCVIYYGVIHPIVTINVGRREPVSVWWKHYICQLWLQTFLRN